MYFVVNISNPPREVTIGDLGICIGPRKTIDLDKIKQSHEIDGSEDLRMAIKLRLVQVRQSIKSKKIEPKIEKSFKQGLNDKDLQKIKEAVKEEIARSSTPPQPQAELLSVLQKLSQIIEQQKDRPIQVIQTIQEVQEAIEDDNISEEKLAEIHSRAIKTITDNAESHVNYQKTEKTNISIDEKADELDKLLG